MSLLLLLTPAPGAWALADPVAGGRTSVRLEDRLYERLRDRRVDFLGVGRGDVRGRVATLPVTTGRLDPDSFGGTVEHAGGLALRAGRRTVVLRQLVLDTARKLLSARVGGRRLRIASLRRVEGGRKGFDAEIAIGALRLTARAATVLNRGLGLGPLFRAGGSLGTATSVAEPEALRIFAPSMGFGLDQTAFAKLQSAGVEANTWATGNRIEGTNPPAFGLEMEGGLVAPDLSSGFLDGESGLFLTPASGASASPPPNLYLTDLSLDLGSKLLLAGVWISSTEPPARDLPATAAIGGLDLSRATIRIRPQAQAIEITGAPVTMTELLAASLNEACGKPSLFAPGDPLGVLSVFGSVR